MVDIRTTKAALVKPEWSDKVPAPAYDSMTPGQRRQVRLANPWSFLNVTVSPEDIAPDRGSDTKITNDELIALAREAIDRIVSAGAFADANDSFFLYQLQKEGHTQTALVADIPTSDYQNGHIKIHEQVQQGRANLLAEHLTRVGVISSPIAMTFRSNEQLSLLFQHCLKDKPLLKIDAGMGIIQTIWEITDKSTISQFITAFAHQSLYIIDGHHRTAATVAANIQNDRKGTQQLPLFSALFPDDELKLLGFNRWVKPDNNRVTLNTLSSLPHCQLINSYRPPTQTELILYIDSQWLSLKLNTKQTDKSSDATDVSLLQTQLLHTVFGIAIGDNSQIENFPGIQGHQKLCDKVNEYGGCAIFVAPLTMDQFLEIADNKNLLPPKSTYFTPKVQSGVFLRFTKD